MSDNENIPIADDGEAQVDTGVDAGAEDAQTTQSEQQQLNSEAKDLDTSNIIDDSPGVTTRGAKVDATKQERAVDEAVDAATEQDEGMA